MSTRALSPREEEIVELSILGLTNDAIAAKLSLSVGTVNTYWLRIRLKVGGFGRTDTVAKVITERAEKALREANVERKELAHHLADRAHDLLELRAALALLQLAMDQIHSTVWATDRNLRIHLIANGEMPTVPLSERPSRRSSRKNSASRTSASTASCRRVRATPRPSSRGSMGTRRSTAAWCGRSGRRSTRFLSRRTRPTSRSTRTCRRLGGWRPACG
ncbi:MAG: response regulator transcription factor [Fimbriimonadaceae bacterium]|nr:response regulator transcription factor [Fimbriimonadaceae bacterium]